MTHIVKKILTILIIINLVLLIFLICVRSRFVTKDPMFGTVINSIIKNEDLCKRFNMSSDNIFDYYGKSVLFDVYSLDDSKYKSNLNLVSNITTERLNINIVDIIFYEEKNIDKVKDFIAKNSINRPVLYVEKSFLSKKLSLDSNSVVLSDLNIDNVIKLKSFDYMELEENVKNLYKKTKKIRNIDVKKVVKQNNDELVIKSIGRMLSVKNDDYNDLFFVDYIGNKIFSIYANGKLDYYIGNGKEDDGNVDKISFNNIRSVKLYNNNLFVLDGIFLKRINLDTNRVDIILQDNILEGVNDFEMIDKNNLIFTTNTEKLITYDDGFNIIKNNFGSINKVVKHDGKIVLSDMDKSKFYIYKNHDIYKFIDLNNILNRNVNIIDFANNNDTLYFVTSENEILMLKNNKVDVRKFNNIKNIKFITVDNSSLYMSDDTNIYELNIKDLNNDNYEKKIKRIDFKFSYKSKNYFTFKEFDFIDANKEIVWLNDILSIVINEDSYIDYKAPNYIDLYEVNGKKISYVSGNSVMNDNVVFDKIDTNKNYYINGKIYYRYDDKIFVKKINNFVEFKDNYVNKNIEINFNNIYLDK